MTTLQSNVTDEPDLVTIIQAYNDVTERLKRSHEALAREVCRLSEELREKNKELERRERLAALGEMAAGVAHEIRNPLGGIGLYASLLARDLADMPRQQDLVRRMTAGLKNLESIVSDILAFACDAEPRQERILLGKVLQGVLIQTTPQADALNVKIEVDERLTSIALHVDAAQLERALINLVFNAVDAAGADRDDAGGRVWIRCGKEDRDNGLLRLTVEDNGPGITPELRHRVYYYAPIRAYRLARRLTLFPHEADHPRANESYFKIEIGPLQALDPPVIAEKLRRITFISTSLDRLLNAREIRELWHKPSYHETLWTALSGQE